MAIFRDTLCEMALFTTMFNLFNSYNCDMISVVLVSDLRLGFHHIRPHLNLLLLRRDASALPGKTGRHPPV